MDAPDIKTREAVFASLEPSQQLRTAVEDLILVEQDPNYTVTMDYWHVPGRICKVCFAGAVLARTVGLSADDDFDDLVDDETFGQPPSLWWLALDHVRDGTWSGALSVWGLPRLFKKFPKVPQYADDPEGFKAAVLAGADILEQAGH